MEIKKSLIKLEQLLSGWGLKPQNWFFTGRDIYRLQGYKVDNKKGQADFWVLVDKDKLPWSVGNHHEIYPPKKSSEFDEYTRFMKVTGHGLHFYAESNKFIKSRQQRKFSKKYNLPNGKKIYMLHILGDIKETERFIRLSSQGKISKEAGSRYLKFLEQVKKIAIRKKDVKIVQNLDKIFKKYKHLTIREADNSLYERFRKLKEIGGQTAYSGKVVGRVKIILKNGQIDSIRKGNILISDMTSPRFSVILDKVRAIVTDEGGITCHAAIVSRELKKPCLVGTKIATKVLRDEDEVEVDATKGIVRKIK